LIQRYFQDYLQNLLQSQIGGTGLGLFLCKSIFEAHGEVWAKNNADGKGSTFAIRVPLIIRQGMPIRSTATITAMINDSEERIKKKRGDASRYSNFHRTKMKRIRL